MTRGHILEFVRRHPLAVVASQSASGAPQAAVVGIVTNDLFHLFFDTLSTSRKWENIQRDARVALVVGWDLEEGCTVQLEGLADEPSGEELAELKLVYFERFPDGVERQSWPSIRYVRVRPTWIRFSDFSGDEPEIQELRLG